MFETFVLTLAHCVFMWEWREGWMKENRRRNKSHDLLSRFRTRNHSHHRFQNCKPLRIGDSIANPPLRCGIVSIGKIWRLFRHLCQNYHCQWSHLVAKWWKVTIPHRTRIRGYMRVCTWCHRVLSHFRVYRSWLEEYVLVVGCVGSCIHRLFNCGVCPCSLVTRHTYIEPLFCLLGTTYGH